MNDEESKQHIGVCVILVNPAGLILFGRRKNSYKAGMLGLPGGRVEVHEPLQDAAQRELWEETGISGLNLQYVGVVRENQEGYDFLHFVFSAKQVEVAPVLCEPDKCEGWQWLEYTGQTSILPGHALAVEMFQNKLTLSDLPRSASA